MGEREGGRERGIPGLTFVRRVRGGPAGSRPASKHKAWWPPADEHLRNCPWSRLRSGQSSSPTASKGCQFQKKARPPLNLKQPPPHSNLAEQLLLRTHSLPLAA